MGKVFLWRPFEEADPGAMLGHKRSGAFLPSPIKFHEIAQALMAVTATCLLAGCGSAHTSPNPALYWVTPAATSYGAALSTLQLNATTGVAGTLVYTPALGTVLAVGSHTLSVAFSPADPARYQPAAATVTLTVNKGTPDITWRQPATISYGTPLGEAQLGANSGSNKGTFIYSPGPGNVLAAGPQTLSVIFTPADGLNYQAATATVSLTVNKATPVVYWPNPAPIAYGVALNSMQLDAITAGVAGTFTYSPPAGTIPLPGSQTLSATYTAADARDYETVTTSQTLIVIDGAPPVITLQPRDQSVTLGQTATFIVSATGPSSVTYQWRKNSVSIGGATSSSYTTSPASDTDNGGSYTVVVSDAVQHTVSAAAKLTVTSPAQSSYYVAINGDDQADGSPATPFATLYRAQIAMRTSAKKVTQIESGTYYLSTQLALIDADQGETWEAAPGANVVLSGGEVITGWTSEERGTYSAQAARPVGLDLTISGVRQIPSARGYDPDKPYTSGWRLIVPTSAPVVSATFKALPADLTASVKPGALVQLLDHNQWVDTFTRIVAVNTDNTLTVAKSFDAGSSNGLAGSWRVLNDPSDISVAGQFGYDATTSRVYIMPADFDDLDSATVVAAQLGTLITIKNVAGITIRGLTFSDTTSDTIQLSGAWDDSQAAIMANNVSNSAISGNSFLNVGKGIVLLGSSYNVVAGNNFEHLGVSGISLSSNCNHNVISTNIFKDIGQPNVAAYGLSINDSSFNLVDGNLIDGVGRWGIVFGPSGAAADLAFSNTGNTFSNNIIRNTSNRTNDTGAIYGGAQTFNGYLDENLLITGNRIENFGGLARNRSGEYGPGFAQGIYMDDHLSGVTITNNVIEGGGTYGVILCHGCSGNTASNNIVIQQPAPVYDRGTFGNSFSSGDMIYNGTARIDLLPSYFPGDMKTTSIIVQASGVAFGGAPARFGLEVDGVLVGTGVATDVVSDFVFKVSVTPHQSHRVGVSLTNGVDVGPVTTELHNLGLIVNKTAVSLAAPEAKGNRGSYGFAAIPDDRLVTNFSITRNIVYRNGGLSQDEFDLTSINYPSYIDPNPGTINSNLLYQSVSGADDPIFGRQALDADSIVADPLFANPALGDYRIQPGSPAMTIGFNVSGVPMVP